MARRKRPTVPQEVSNYIVESYVRLRKLAKDDEEQKKSHSYTSARTLLGVLRLAQALARLRLANEVEHGDVDEALRLMEVSKESLYDDEDRDRDPDMSPTSQIYRIIKGIVVDAQTSRMRPRKRAKRMGKGPGGERDMDVDDDGDDDEELSLVEIRGRILAAGFTEAQLQECLVEVSNFLTRFRMPLTDRPAKQYEHMDIWLRVANNTKLRLINI